MTKTNYNINSKLRKNQSLISVELQYKDSFFDDNYYLKGFINESKITFSVYKNKKQMEKVSFVLGENIENNTFLRELNISTKDYDLMEDFKKNHFKDFYNELSDYITKDNSSIIMNNQIFEGYKTKIQSIAGIKKVNQNLR
tara:strand:+ start:369 stop:791 length:423 start_codon:yes stop_codon:yes gene_type:complete